MIRVAARDDLAGIFDLERRTPTAPHWPFAEYERLLLPGDGVERVLLIAAEAGRIVGFAVGQLAGDEAELESVAVDGEVQGRGLGGQLCRAAMDWASAAGAQTMRLEVRSGSVAACKLYKTLGFREVGRRPGYYSDPKDDAVLMRFDFASG